MTWADTINAMATSLGEITEPEAITVHTNPVDTVDAFPAVVLFPPSLDYTNTPYNSPFPRDGKFLVYCVVDPTGTDVPTALYALQCATIQAIWNVMNATITDGQPGSWKSGNQELPAYVITVEAAL